MSACKCRQVCGETKPGKRCKCGCHEPPSSTVRPYTPRSAADEIVAWTRTGIGINGTVHGIIIDAIEDAQAAIVDPISAILAVECPTCYAPAGRACSAEHAKDEGQRLYDAARIRAALVKQ